MLACFTLGTVPLCQMRLGAIENWLEKLQMICTRQKKKVVFSTSITWIRCAIIGVDSIVPW